MIILAALSTVTPQHSIQMRVANGDIGRGCPYGPEAAPRNSLSGPQPLLTSLVATLAQTRFDGN